MTSVISLIPQILHTCRTRSAKDLSLLMLINFFICAISWVCYGLLTGARTVWVTNAMSTVCIIILIALKIRYTKKSKG